MRLIKRLIELAVVILVISLFMKNKDVAVTIDYFGLTEPITVAFWELVTFCVSLGIIIAAFGDFITQLKWVRERRRMIKTDKEHRQVVDGLNEKIENLEEENAALKKDLEKAEKEAQELKERTTATAESPPHGFSEGEVETEKTEGKTG